MPAFLLSPLVKWSLATLGGAMVVHWVVKEARRITPQGRTILAVGDANLDAASRLKLVVDPAGFLDHPMHDHGAAQSGE